MARSFDGTDDKVEIADIRDPSTEITTVIRVKYANVTQDTHATIFNKRHQESNPFNTWVVAQNSFNQRQMRFELAVSGATKTTATAGAVTVLKWYTLVARWKSGEVLQLRIFDDVGGIHATVETAVTASGSITYLSPNVRIGSSNGTSQYFEGDVCDAAIYDIKLTDDEVQSLGNGVLPNRIRTSNLVFYMPLQGLASPEPDISGNTNNGTLTGTTRANNPSVKMHTRIERASFTEIATVGAALVKIINETVNISETTNRLKGIIRSINETVQLTEANNSIRGLVKNITETINISESQNKITGIIKNITETIQITENTNRLSNMVRNISETVQITETNNRLSNLVRNVDETIQFTEGVNRLKGIIRSVNETIQVSELNNSVKGLIRIVNETLNITENTNKVTGIIKNINETLQIAEIQNKTRNLVRVISETIQINEIQNKTRNLVRNISESIQFTETQNRTMSLVRSINETIQLSESSVMIRGLIKVVNDIVNFAEGIIKKLGVPPTTKTKPTTDSITYDRGCNSIVLNRGCNSIIIS